MFKKGDKKIINAWAFYDWANSSYPLVITTAIFPIYYSQVTDSQIALFGRNFNNSALYSYTFSLSFLLVAIMSPLLSGIADYTGKKKLFMQFFCYLGASCCAMLWFFSQEYLVFSLLMVIGASVGFWGSIVFYNAYLPEIAKPEIHDQISAKGYSLGYIGSSLLLIINLVLIMMPELIFDLNGKAAQLLQENPSLSPALALEEAKAYFALLAVKISFISVAVWWAGFAQITFAKLPSNMYKRKPSGNILLKGFRELKTVYAELQYIKGLQIYLLAFLFYSMGVQTVMLMATLFGEQEVEMSSEQLIATVLVIQFVAIAGAHLFAFLSSKFGNIKALGMAIMIWIGICLAAYFVRVASEFYVIAGLVGLVMGGIQSLSRSTYSKMLPETKDHASYFSFYDVTEKIAIVVGTLSYGLIVDITGSMRNSVFVLMAFFIVGLMFLMFIPKPEKKTASATCSPENEENLAEC